MNDEFEGKIEAGGEFELHPPFWKRLKEALSSPEISERLVRAVGRKRTVDWYDIRTYRLDDARADELITDFPRDGDCILVLSITSGASASIKYDSSVSDSFDLVEYRKLRHNFSNLFLTNAALGGATLQLLFGKGDWEVERHHPEEEIMSINADTVDSLHASASVEAGKLLALDSDGKFPNTVLDGMQSEVYANRPATPALGDMFIARDTSQLLVCFTAGVWTDVTVSTAADITFTPAGDIVATDVQAAIEELDTEKLADVADVIKDGHIDWGTGANQVSAADMPIADPGGIITAVQVEGALQEIMIDLNGFPDELKNLIAHEIQQLETLGGVITISNAQWGYLGACTAAGGALLDDANAAAQLATLGLSTNLADLTDAEAAQLENIGPTTISGAQWAILGVTTNWTTWVPNIVGDADLSGYDTARYCRIGHTCFFYFGAENKNVTTAGSAIQVTLPHTAIAGPNPTPTAQVNDGAAWIGLPHIVIAGGGNVMYIYKNAAVGGWAGTENGVYIRISGFYEIA